MPGTIQVSVLGLVDVQTASSTTSIKGINLTLLPILLYQKKLNFFYLAVAMGKIEYRTSDSGDYIFPVTRLQENLIVTLLDVNGNGILHKEIETRMIIESGFLEEKVLFNGYGNVQLKMQFVLSEEDRNRIRFLRQSALRKKHKELVGGSSFTKSKSIASDLSSLSPMQTRDTVAAASPKTALALSQETEVKTSVDREPVSSNLITWKAEVKGITEKKKTNQPSSSDVSLSKKLPEVKKLESVSLLEQEDKGLIKPEKIPNRKPMRRSLSETNLSNVRKMISTFEVKVTQDTNLLMGKSQTEDVKENAKAQSQPKSSVNIEKPKERKISSDTTEICDHIVTVSREERPLVIEHKSPEESTIRSDSLSKQRIKRSSVVEVSNDEKKQSKPVRLKDSHLENARGSRLWIFPDEAKDVLQKKTEESKKANTGEMGLSCRSIEKMNINNKWKNIERLKKQKSQTSADSESSRGPVGQVMRALIVVGFAGLVFLTRK
ncbi:uncharacterized protein LOC103856793 isoform X2 [Brassica rapa]|uniref:Uncharacterized protein n=1 Tax=Brassica campestris TaxID=3711 RepID=M4CRL1_BRACM|nr:uncharacterized protein LOC103856793 isoform X2 [Brassica rapa]